MVNKSPSIISAEHFTQVYRQLRGKVGSHCRGMAISFAHPCHYANQRALTNLHRAGIKLQVLNLEEILLEALKDCFSNIKGLERCNIEKLRGLTVMLDHTMLRTAHYMLLNAFQINMVTLGGYYNGATPAKDEYVIKLEQDMKRLMRSNSKNRKPKEVKSGHPCNTEIKEDKQNEKVVQFHTRNKMSDLLGGEVANQSNKGSMLVENMNAGVGLDFDCYKEFLLIGCGVNKVPRNKPIEGRWLVECYDDHTSVYQDSGLIYKTTVGAGLEVQMTEIFEKIKDKMLDSEGIRVKNEIVLASFPDKTNSTQLMVALAEKLEKELKLPVDMQVWCSTVESMNVPCKETMRRLFLNNEDSNLTKSVRVLHAHDVFNFLFQDLKKFLINFHMVVPERGIHVTVQENELNSAMNLLLNAVQVCDNTQPYNKCRLTDTRNPDKLIDLHHKTKSTLLQAIIG
uniref:uncharacterized protein LOC108951040 isoform X2 n=1 Tax=Ciona intestinalis TaxID=7719 RepID=UPI000EF46112|nr:uncharacterized protein LOC108951040 isoform X2 [Ciona intestinalis]|eukprot:XP_026696346.1 uncharacterized protein LOC108951040 isoform X2 [Ciona intestinalis]